MRIVIFPLFLFSGTFFPVSRLPDWIEWVSLLSPLWQRGRAVPRRDHRRGRRRPDTVAEVVLHVAVLLVWIGVGWLRTRTSLTQ